jgi:SAM-dependent methyltransferase
MLAPTYEEAIAKNYDADYAQIRDPSGDREFYAALAREADGPVLELGCGTGRVLLPIASTGVSCVGLDPSPAMLNVLRSKLPPPNLELIEGTMTGFDLGDGRFKLIYSAFRAFQHLTTVEEQLAALACIRRHLADGGVFAFDVFAPLFSRLAMEEEPEQQDSLVDAGDTQVRRFTKVWRDHKTQVQRVRLRYETWRGDQKLSDEQTEITMRWFHPFELEHLLARAGFVSEFYGGYDRRPFNAKNEMIVVARRAG